MLKRQQNNMGYTLVELIVSIAILAFIGVAIGGLMSSNTVIFRKSKNDLDVQNVSQDAFNRISNDVMQAKSVYIEGYTTGSEVEFGSNLYGGDTGVAVGSTVQCLVDSDVNLLEAYTAVPSNADLETKKAAITDAAAKAKFNKYYYKLRYMTDEERELYSSFINNIGSGPFTPFSSLKTAAVGGTQKYSYTNVYLTKMIVMYLTPYDSKYAGATPAPAGTVYDTCKVTYTFLDDETSPTKAVIRVKTEYKYMSAIDNDETFTEYVNYRKNGSDVIPGVVAQVDGENNAIGLKIYFNKAEGDEAQGRKFNSEGIIKLRNSNVLSDAK